MGVAPRRRRAPAPRLGDALERVAIGGRLVRPHGRATVSCASVLQREQVGVDRARAEPRPVLRHAGDQSLRDEAVREAQ